MNPPRASEPLFHVFAARGMVFAKTSPRAVLAERTEVADPHPPFVFLFGDDVELRRGNC